MEDILYHYTSIPTLALILKNKNIRFNNLLNVDDMEEGQSQDYENASKLIYISSWTQDEKESIALWKLYTPEMHGVRIGLPKFPFKKYDYKKGEYNLKQDVQGSYINLEELIKTNKTSITIDSPLLINVDYTNDENLLKPQIITVTETKVSSFGKVENTTNVNYDFSKIGKYKRTHWEFQKEVRYWILCAPYSISEASSHMSNPMELMNFGKSKMEDKNMSPPISEYYLNLSEEALSKMEILLSPLSSSGEKIIVNTLVEKYCPSAKVENSLLKLRNKWF